MTVDKKPTTRRRNTSLQFITEERRREVAALRRRRLTMRQIAQALEDAGRVNPRTGRPWSLAIIGRDVQHITDQARAEAVRDISEHKAEILADYHELLRIAWSEREYDRVQRILGDLRSLLGTDAPQVIIFEQVTERMTAALDALEAEFRDEPALLERAWRALMGAADPGAPRITN